MPIAAMVFFPCCCSGLFTTLLLLTALSDVEGDCNSPSRIQHAELSGQMQYSYPIGTALTYHCLPGYEPIPGTSPQIMCSPASEWLPADPQFCEGRRCPSPEIENGKIVSSTDLRLGDQITFICDNGYKLMGQKTSRCTFSSGTVDWDDLPSCKRISCFSPPDIINGRKIGGHRVSYGSGSEITYVCDHGFSLIGSKTLTCRAAANGVDGEWDSELPECKVVRCSRPEIAHGSTSSFHPSYTYGHSLMITCDAGYTLSGDSLVKCGADSYWHPSVPTCVSESKSLGDRLNDIEEKLDTISRNVIEYCRQNA